jgi:hypothetical protein
VSFELSAVCDLCGRYVEILGSGSRERLETMLARFREEGWRYTESGKTLCPNCVEKVFTAQGLPAKEAGK